MMKICLGTRRVKLIACIAIAMFVSRNSKAQDSLRLSLNEVLEIALSDNPTIQVADQEIELKRYVKKETIAGLFPDISASGVMQDALKLQSMKMGMEDQEPMIIKMGQKYTMNATFNLSLPLVAPQLWKTIKLNQKDVELAMEVARSSKIDMVNQVKNAYYSLLLAKDAYKALSASYKTAEMNAQFVTSNYEQGLASEYDKLVADVQFRNIKPQMVNGENAVKLAILNLKVLMGVDVNQPIIFTGELDNYETEMLSDYMYLKNDTSLVDNSVIKQFDIQAEQIRESEKINKMGYVPTLALGLNYGWQAMHKDLRMKNYDWFPGSVLSFSLSVPIFDGGKKYYKTKQNNISYGNLLLQRENTVRQLELSVQNSLDNISTAIEQVTSNKESVIQADKAYSISQKRYAVGSGTLLEMNTSETALTQARLQYAQSIYDYLAAKANLEATLGRPVTQYGNSDN